MKWIEWIIYGLWLAMGFLLGAATAKILPLSKLLLGNDGRLQWEVLITGFAAVSVAGLTVAKLNQQILQAENLAANQRTRRARAARSVLPLVLSELSQYASTCIKGLYSLRPCFQVDGSLDRTHAGKSLTSWQPPHLPENVLSSLKETIEFSEDVPAEAMADLIRHYQVQNYRLSEDVAHLRLNDGVHLLLWANIEQGVLDAAELQARVSVLFPFSRGDSEHVPPVESGHVRNALFTARCFATLNDIDRLVAEWERHKDAPSPRPPA